MKRAFLAQMVIAFVGPVAVGWVGATLYLSFSPAPSFDPAKGLEVAARLFQNATFELVLVGVLCSAIMTSLGRIWDSPPLIWTILGFGVFVLTCILWQNAFGSLTGTFLRHDLAFLLKPGAVFCCLSGIVHARLRRKRPSSWGI